MNEAAKEIQVAKSVSGSVLGYPRIGDPVRSSLRGGSVGQSGTANLDLPSDISLRIYPGPSWKRQEKSAEHLCASGHGTDGCVASYELRGKRRRPRHWHKLFWRWPNTTSYCVCGAFVATLIGIIEIVPR